MWNYLSFTLHKWTFITRFSFFLIDRASFILSYYFYQDEWVCLFLVWKVFIVWITFIETFFSPLIFIFEKSFIDFCFFISLKKFFVFIFLSSSKIFLKFFVFVYNENIFFFSFLCLKKFHLNILIVKSFSFPAIKKDDWFFSHLKLFFLIVKEWKLIVWKFLWFFNDSLPFGWSTLAEWNNDTLFF